MGVKRSGGLGGKIASVVGSMRSELSTAVYAIAAQVEVDAATSITSGAVSGKGHVPSKPGEPPNADTHQLDRSIHVKTVTPLNALVVADAPHAASMELGTSKVAERPYMRPAAQRNKARGQRQMRASVAHVITGGKFRGE